MLRDLACRLGGFSLRFSSTGWGVESLQKAVKILRPKILIIDDICRSSTDNMLDAIESIKKTVPLIAASANYTDKLDPALRRPGRFDRSVLVTHLDGDTLDSMTSGIDERDLDRLSQLPAAFVTEYILTHRIEGPDEAAAILPILEQLAEEINAADAPDGLGRVGDGPAKA